MSFFPQRIVCLTEEPTEWLYLLGEERRIVGISGYTVRPPQARLDKPKVSAFLSAKIDKILALKPDCVIGFSDLQADIAAQLIRAGVAVHVFNQRSMHGILPGHGVAAALPARGGSVVGGVQGVDGHGLRVRSVACAAPSGARWGICSA